MNSLVFFFYNYTDHSTSTGNFILNVIPTQVSSEVLLAYGTESILLKNTAEMKRTPFERFVEVSRMHMKHKDFT